MGRRCVRLGVLIVTIWLAGAVTSYAQSGIAGVVRDATGAVMPGVTVEAASPALIEKLRIATSDAQGQYRFDALRPGEYSVKFTLAGFSTLVRDGILLDAGFTATVNVDLKVGAVEESVSVTGQAPVVDVHSTTRQEVIPKALIEALPTGRNYETLLNTLPAVSFASATKVDVGGSTTMQQTNNIAYGSQSDDFRLEIDGIEAATSNNGLGVYLNLLQFQEFVVQINGGDASARTGAIRLNLVPKEGGNDFHGLFFVSWANQNMQANNLTGELKARGLTTAPALAKWYDIDPILGGPIIRDKLWFFGGYRRWAYNSLVGGSFLDRRPVPDDNQLQSYASRLTYQLKPKIKINGSYERTPKWRGHRGIELGGIAPEAAAVQTCPSCGYGQVKILSPVTSKLLVDVGFGRNYFIQRLNMEPEVKIPTASLQFGSGPPVPYSLTPPYGDIGKVDLVTGLSYGAPASLATVPSEYVLSKANTVASVAYVTGSHALKVGVQYYRGWNTQDQYFNGDITQRYRNGVPDSVIVYNTPTSRRNDYGDLGLYVQDSWTVKRLTINPGVRWQWYHGWVPAQNVPAGRFVPARRFDSIDDLPNFKNVTPVFSLAWDVFGDGTTAIRGGAGMYTPSKAANFQNTYNPSVTASDIRTWRDLNGDNIADENEIGPSQNRTFGVRRNQNPSPDLKSEYQALYNLAVQRQLRPGLGVGASYNYRRYYNIRWSDNLAIADSDYTLITIPDPRGSGTLPLYSIDPAKNALVDILDLNSTSNSTVYQGIDFNINGRFKNGSVLTAGTSTGRIVTNMCQVEDLNALRFCDQTALDIPYRTILKVSGTYPLPYGVRLSGVFQGNLGAEISQQYIVNKAIAPTLTQSQVIVQLNQPGTLFQPRINQLDMSVSKGITFQGLRIAPQLELFNILGASTVVNSVTTYGSSFGTPLLVMGGRMAKIGMQIDF